ncbi:hypothetical protein M2271_001847 [Streptomyces sp. LBL]|uniref:hypothetical protein n=1 Tax=Streptomyces sp. LBL TaxID=2940562 RepID=UPI0024762D2E|nr:hypothetical protein [Streptomyces sp. LBL]MDH6624050.1 hypothetical protein [Streptomyces sp. LBL]
MNTARRTSTLPPSGLTAATFRQAGTVRGPTASARASVLVRRRGPYRYPLRERAARTGAPLEIVWGHPVREAVRADDAAEVLSTDRRLGLIVTPARECATHEREVALG